MIKVAVGPPTTPVTEGSTDMAMCTAPNICKMPGPPAPFVPVHLPNLGRSQDKLSAATSTVKMHKKKVAIRGTYYYSTGSPDVASKGTGGGLVSAQTQGKTEFVAPGAMNVKAEGKNIQLLGDAMTNNGGSPSNSICAKNAQAVATATGLTLDEITIVCEAFCQAQQDYTDKKKSARGRGKVTSRFQKLLKKALKKAQDEGRARAGLVIQAEGWMFKAAHGIAYRALTATALTAVAAGHGGMGPVIGTALAIPYAALGAYVPGLFRPDLIATVAGRSTVLEAKFFWDTGKDKLTKAQTRAANKMGDKFVQLKPDGSDGSPCKCPDSAIP